MAQSPTPGSVHYPPALTDLTMYQQIRDKPGLKGGALLVFRDELGTVVTLRLHDTAIRSLSQALAEGPTPELEGT